MRYSCIERRRADYPVQMMCRLLRVSRSGYYAWRVRPESARSRQEQELTTTIREVHEASRGVYGSPKITAELQEQGYVCGRHKVARLMRAAGLRGCPARRFRVTTQRDPSHPVATNLLNQDFTATSPDQRWASDLTYIPTQQGWLYLAVVMDLYSRRIVGWSMSAWKNRHLVVDALVMAWEQRQPTGVVIHHSDRGSQYTSDDFREALKVRGMTCSMSDTGNCYDNAAVESFFGLLKRERVHQVRYRTRDEARTDIFDYIECFYNRKRRHGYLGNVSPAVYEEKCSEQFETVH